MVILEQNFKWHLEAFASELFIYILSQLELFWILNFQSHLILFYTTKYISEYISETADLLGL